MLLKLRSPALKIKETRTAPRLHEKYDSKLKTSSHVSNLKTADYEQSWRLPKPSVKRWRLKFGNSTRERTSYGEKYEISVAALRQKEWRRAS